MLKSHYRCNYLIIYDQINKKYLNIDFFCLKLLL